MKPSIVASVFVIGVCFAQVALGHGVVTYEADVRPIFERNCGGGSCHIGGKVGGVDLSSYDAVMASIGVRYGGRVVVPGDPETSPIVDKIKNDTPRFGQRMPRGAEPLSGDDIHTIEEWIEGGAIRHLLPLRGDANNDDQVNLTDAVFLLNYLFLESSPPECVAVADSNKNDSVDLTDAVYLLNYLFLNGPAPVAFTDEEFEACRGATELSFDNIYQKVFAATCAFSSCHSDKSRKGGLSLESADVAFADLVGVAAANVVAGDAGWLRVAPGDPDRSFLLRKLVGPGPGEGNRMPLSSPDPLSDETIAAIRSWIVAGAPREGTISGVPAIRDEPAPPIGGIPKPPEPEFGIQLHLPPFPIASRSEREIFYFVDAPFKDVEQDEIEVERIDVFMMEQSHHFVLYEFIGAGKPAAGVRPVEAVLDVLGTRRVAVISQQSFFSLAFPAGVGLKFSKDSSFDLNSHYVNVNGQETLMGEVYVNIHFAQPGSVETVVKPIFEINPNIRVPPDETRTTSWMFPGPTSANFDPRLGANGMVARTTHIYSLTSHMHRHGDRFTAFLTENRRDVEPQQVLYDNLSWDDPVYTVFDPPLVLEPRQGIRFDATHTYHDPPSPNAPPLVFDVTSEDEMAILIGYYAIP